MGIARMRQQCIPGRFFLPRKKWPGNEASTTWFHVEGVSALRKCRMQRDTHVHVHVYADVGA